MTRIKPIKAARSESGSEVGRRFRLAGPLKGDYSLAIVNRYFAKALIESGVHLTLEPQESDLCDDQMFIDSGLIPYLLPEHSAEPSSAFDLFSANDWPIRAATAGQTNALHCFAWEESILPFEIANRLSGYDLVATTAGFVTTACRNSGVTSRIVTVGNGVDHIRQVNRKRPLREYDDGRPFIFMHISSCFPRKGIDVLLDAYFSEFTSDDNVRLIVKTFDNPHNQGLRAQILHYQREHPNAPAVDLNIVSLDSDGYYSLFLQADCLVAPSYGEGFLFPAAEAMLNNIPVITTNWGGQSDFCTNDTAWLIESRLEASASHVAAPGALWARPDLQHLRSLMRTMTKLNVEQRAERLQRGRTLLETDFSWRKVVQRFLGALQEPQPVKQQFVDDAWKAPRTARHSPVHAVISTFNQKCGVATFTRDLLDAAAEHHCIAGVITEIYDRSDIILKPFNPLIPVKAVWRRHSSTVPAIIDAALDLAPDHVLIEHHPGIYSWDMLGNIVAGLAGRTRISVEVHAATEAQYDLLAAASRLQFADRFITHGSMDYAVVAKLFGSDRVAFFRHGIGAAITSNADTSTAGPIRLASFGFAAPHKGFHKVIEAMAILRQAGVDTSYYIYSSLDPTNGPARTYIKYCYELAIRHKLECQVHFELSFLDIDEAIARLSECDIGLMLYDEVSEGASGAVRVMLRASTPLVVSRTAIFADLFPVCQSVGDNILALARVLYALISDPSERQRIQERQAEYIEATSWSRVASMVFEPFDAD